MKKQNLKSLKLVKKSVANLQSQEVKGGAASDHPNCDHWISQLLGGGSYCHCL